MTSAALKIDHVDNRLASARWTLPGVGLGLILLAMCAAYWPARYGEIVWDDDVNVMNRAVCSSDGLYRIWFEPGATQQYYPVLYSAFWLEHRLWGDNTLGFHLVNVLWHAVSVLLLYLILHRNKVAGAVLAAAIFAVHPVMVESVAWMTEQRNTLSTVFYLSSMLVYLEFDKSRRRSTYFLTIGFFVAALLSKTVTVTLPVALLIIFWWQRGTLSWKRDVLPLVPFFVVAAAAGVMTAWIEWTFVGAAGADYELTFLQRFLVAGRAIWFYLAKLIWPTNLTFVYPRWTVDPEQWWQWIFPFAVLVMTVALWSVRNRWRTPLAGWPFYCGTLFPVLGFLNFSYFAYSFVADHLQYLPSLGLIVPAAAAITQGVARLPPIPRRIGIALCIFVLTTLAVLTGRQSRMFADRTTLYETTIDRNPACWMAHTNLAADLLDSGHDQEAIEHLKLALRIYPRNVAGLSNYGLALARAGRLNEAVDVIHQALAINPDYTIALHDLGLTYAQMNRYPEAIECYQRVLQLHPQYTEARKALAASLYSQDKIPEAMEQFRLILQHDPNNLEARTNLGRVLYANGDVAMAIPQFEAALQIEPRLVDIRHVLGDAYRAAGRLQNAIDQYDLALRLKSDFVPAYVSRAEALAAAGRSEEAAASAEKGIEISRLSGQEAAAEQLEEWLKHYRKELQRAEPASSAP